MSTVQVTSVHIDPGYAYYLGSADGVPTVGGSLSTGQVQYIADALAAGLVVTAETTEVTGYRYVTGFKVSAPEPVQWETAGVMQGGQVTIVHQVGEQR